MVSINNGPRFGASILQRLTEANRRQEDQQRLSEQQALNARKAQVRNSAETTWQQNEIELTRDLKEPAIKNPTYGLLTHLDVLQVVQEYITQLKQQRDRDVRHGSLATRSSSSSVDPYEVSIAKIKEIIKDDQTGQVLKALAGEGKPFAGKALIQFLDVGGDPSGSDDWSTRITLTELGKVALEKLGRKTD